MENLRVAVIQLYAIPLEPEKNFAKAETLIRNATEEGVNLAVLPEYHLSNWIPQDERFTSIARQYKKYIAQYQSLAKELGICIVPGTIVATESEDDSDEKAELINIAVFIDRSGNVLNTYKKRNLWHPEREHLTSGKDDHKAFDTQFGPVGLLICWDLAFNEAFRELITQGARIIIVPAYWLKTDGQSNESVHNPNSESVFLDSVLVSRAFENNCCVIFCNAGGPSEEYLGISQVTLPLTGRLERLPDGQEATLIADVDMKIVDAAEQTYKIRKDLNNSEWHYNQQKPAEASPT